MASAKPQRLTIAAAVLVLTCILALVTKVEALQPTGIQAAELPSTGGKELVVEGDEWPLAAFAEALDGLRLREPMTKVRIAYFGDSHTASDGLTGALRDLFAAKYGDGGHGFVLTGTPWILYSPKGLANAASKGVVYQSGLGSKYPPPFGIGGLKTILKSAGANVTIASIDDGHAGSLVSSVVVYYLSGAEPSAWSLTIDTTPFPSTTTASPTNKVASESFDVSLGAHSIAITLEGGAPLTLLGATIETDTPGTVVDSLGVPGATIATVEHYGWDVMAEQLESRSPALFVTAFGTNEVFYPHLKLSSYHKKYAKVLAKLRAITPTASCLVVGPPDVACPEAPGGDKGCKAWCSSMKSTASCVTPKKLAGIIEIQKNVAAEAGCAFFDSFAAMGGAGTIKEWAASKPPLAKPDHIHLTDEGAAELAKLLFEAIEEEIKGAPDTLPSL